MTDSDELARDYDLRRRDLTYVRDRLETIVRDALVIPHLDRIAFRVKDTSSFVTKALKTQSDGSLKYADPFRQIEDQIAGRVIVFFRSDLDAARDCLLDVLGPVEDVRKEPAGPSEFGYESDHFIFVIPEHVTPAGWSGRFDVPATFEMQVRTLFQHAWAEPQHDVGYKGGELSQDTRRELAWIAASAWGADMTLERLQGRLRKDG
jgi:putative GTP pyrophosphokinase